MRARPSSIRRRSKDSTRSAGGGAGHRAWASNTTSTTFSRRAERPVPVNEPRRDHSMRRRVPSLGAGAAGAGGEGTGKRAGVGRRARRRRSIARRCGEAVLKTMERLKLDAFVYPDLEQSAAADRRSEHAGGDNSQLFSPTTGFPAINVPMGYTRGRAAGRHDNLRPCLERGQADPPGVRLRAGDAAPAAAGVDAAAPVRVRNSSQKASFSSNCRFRLPDLVVTIMNVELTGLELTDPQFGWFRKS